MKQRALIGSLFAVTLVVVTGLVSGGCEGGDSVIRDVAIQVSGRYTFDPDIATGAGFIASMTLTQTGSELQAITNVGTSFFGTIGQDSSTMATFVLEGKNAFGDDAQMTGTIAVAEGSSQATMLGTYFDPSTVSSINGTATVPTNNPPDDGDGDGNGTNVVTTATI